MDKIVMSHGEHKVTIEYEELGDISDVLDTFIVPGLLGLTYAHETIIRAMRSLVEEADEEADEEAQ